MKRSDAPSAGFPSRSGGVIAAAIWPALIILLLWPLGSLLQDPAVFDPYFIRILCLVGLNISLAVSLQLINGISGQFSLGHAGFMAIGAYMAAYPAQALLTPDPSTPHARFLTNPLAPMLFYADIALVVIALAPAVVPVYLILRSLRRLGNWAMAMGLVVLALWVIADLAMASNVSADAPAIYLVWSSIGHWLLAMFDAVLATGLPLTQAASARLPHAIAQPATCLTLLVGAGLCAAGAGLLIGVPVLRLRGDYLAIATLGFAEIIAVLITNSQPLGGALGLSDIPRFAGFGWIYGVAVFTVLAVWRLTHSARGRAMLAVREDEIAASAIGIDPARSRVLAFVVGAFFAGVAGALFAHFEGYITPRHFQFLRSIELVVMVTLAGAGSISGTILAAIVLTLLPELLRSFSEWRMVSYSLLLIVMMLLRPEGLLGGRELIPKRWRGEADAAA